MCGDSYHVVKRLGEGGESGTTYSLSFQNKYMCTGFSYVELVHRQGHNYALVSVLLGVVYDYSHKMYLACRNTCYYKYLSRGLQWRLRSEHTQLYSTEMCCP